MGEGSSGMGGSFSGVIHGAPDGMLVETLGLPASGDLASARCAAAECGHASCSSISRGATPVGFGADGDDLMLSAWTGLGTRCRARRVAEKSRYFSPRILAHE